MRAPLMTEMVCTALFGTGWFSGRGGSPLCCLSTEVHTALALDRNIKYLESSAVLRAGSTTDSTTDTTTTTGTLLERYRHQKQGTSPSPVAEEHL